MTDCASEAEKSGLLCRQEPIGFDRHRRKYWFLCRRIVVYVLMLTTYMYTPKANYDKFLFCSTYLIISKESFFSEMVLIDKIMVCLISGRARLKHGTTVHNLSLKSCWRFWTKITMKEIFTKLC